MTRSLCFIPSASYSVTEFDILTEYYTDFYPSSIYPIVILLLLNNQYHVVSL